MIRRPPRSTLFPTRRSSDLSRARRPSPSHGSFASPETARLHPRSEEHTSELQSHVNLVCRLLLEKKKKTRRLLYKNEKNTDHQYRKKRTQSRDQNILISSYT